MKKTGKIRRLAVSYGKVEEQRNHNPRVDGSNPPLATNKKPLFGVVFYWL